VSGVEVSLLNQQPQKGGKSGSGFAIVCILSRIGSIIILAKGSHLGANVSQLNNKRRNMLESKRSKSAMLTSLSAGMAAAFVPQFSYAGLITVGGDGGTGSVTLNNGDRTDIGGVLARTLTLSLSGSEYGSLRDNGAALGRQRLFPAIRSSVAATVTATGAVWTFNASSAQSEGALFGSDDNWVAGHFSVNGINAGNLIYGWLQIGLNTGNANGTPNQLTVLSFTYDDAATDTTAFTKPVGGFTVGSAVPEPGTLGLAALALGAAGVARRRRALKFKAAA